MRERLWRGRATRVTIDEDRVGKPRVAARPAKAPRRKSYSGTRSGFIVRGGVSVGGVVLVEFGAQLLRRVRFQRDTGRGRFHRVEAEIDRPDHVEKKCRLRVALRFGSRRGECRELRHPMVSVPALGEQE